MDIERLVPHPELPLVIGLEAAREALRVWSFEGDRLRELDSVVLDETQYDDLHRHRQNSSVAWHPRDPEFVVAGPAGLLRWTAAGGFTTTELKAVYGAVAFSPDGSTVWAEPSSVGDEERWYQSDALDLATGELRTGLNRWDTGIVAHPAGGLVLTLSSDQGATNLLFALVENTRPRSLRVLRRALTLDADGYSAPLISPDGRSIAVRGNAYDNHVEIFDFPSLRLVLNVPLGDPNPGYPTPPEWMAEFFAWSRHSIAFAADSSLLIGTPEGMIVQLATDGTDAARHDLLGGAAVTALAVGVGGVILVAAAGSGVRVLDPLTLATPDPAPAPRQLVEDFVASTSPIPDQAGEYYLQLDEEDGSTEK